MDSALANPTPALDIKTLLARIDQRIALLRTWMSHDHGDEPYWWARHTNASRVQSERAVLRRVADLLHVERASSCGRIHGTRFTDLEAQHAWLRHHQHRVCATAAQYAGVPSYATLALLSEGKLPL